MRWLVPSIAALCATLLLVPGASAATTPKPGSIYRDGPSGKAIGRSEGLAIASLDMFANGAFSSDARDPLRVDADKLADLPLAALEQGFQLSRENPLIGLEGRADLLRRLSGSVMPPSSDLWAAAYRPWMPVPGNHETILREPRVGLLAAHLLRVS